MQKLCRQSGESFEITKEDLSFYEKMNVLPPTLCPEERQRRRLAFRNERTLFKRKCSGSGREIIGMYPQNTSFPVYDHGYFFSDKWNPLSYGRDFNFNKPFFEQFFALFQAAPRILNYSVGNENAQYGNLSSWNKDCYMLFESDNNRDSLFSEYSFRNKNIIDCSYTKQSELCYQCSDILNSFNLRYCLNCKNCSDSWFLKNCIGCMNCFGCMNLRNKQYYFLNEKLNREEFKTKIDALGLESQKNIQKEWKNFLNFTKKFPHKYLNGFQNENCTGDYLNNCKNAQDCFDSSELRDCKYIFNSERIKDSYDIDTYGGVEGSERVYECQSVGRGSFNVAFGNNVYQNLIDVYYCDNCINSKDLFGCISLNHYKYCIFNKQYTEEEYKILRKKIVDHMRKTPATAGSSTGEWGEFFPIKYSPFPYNETMAQFFYPLQKEEALKAGYSWCDPNPKEFQHSKIEIPDRISETPDPICEELLSCETTGRNFKIQKAELSFYKRNHLPLPRKHPEQRFKERMDLRNPRKLWARKCDKCGMEIYTTYSPNQPEIVYCEKCYAEAVN